MLVALLLLAAGCSDGPSDPGGGGTPDLGGLTLSQATLDLTEHYAIGEIGTTATTADGTVVGSAPVSWTSRDTLVARVTDDGPTGVIEAWAEGSTWVVASWESYADSVRVSVTPTVTAVRIIPGSVNALAGGDVSIAVTLVDLDGASVSGLNYAEATRFAWSQVR